MKRAGSRFSQSDKLQETPYHNATSLQAVSKCHKDLILPRHESWRLCAGEELVCCGESSRPVVGLLAARLATSRSRLFVREALMPRSYPRRNMTGNAGILSRPALQLGWLLDWKGMHMHMHMCIAGIVDLGQAHAGVFVYGRQAPFADWLYFLDLNVIWTVGCCLASHCHYYCVYSRR